MLCGSCRRSAHGLLPALCPLTSGQGILRRGASIFPSPSGKRARGREIPSHVAFGATNARRNRRGGMALVWKARQFRSCIVAVEGGCWSGKFAQPRFSSSAPFRSEAAATSPHPNMMQTESAEHSPAILLMALRGRSEPGLVNLRICDWRFAILPGQRRLIRQMQRLFTIPHRGVITRPQPSNVSLDATPEPHVMISDWAKIGSAGVLACESSAASPSRWECRSGAGTSETPGGDACDYMTSPSTVQCGHGRLHAAGQAGLREISVGVASDVIWSPWGVASTTSRTPRSCRLVGRNHVRQVHELEPVSPLLLNPSFRATGNHLLMCLSKESSRRYSAVHELGRLLGRFHAASPSTTPLSSPRKKGSGSGVAETCPSRARVPLWLFVGGAAWPALWHCDGDTNAYLCDHTPPAKHPAFSRSGCRYSGSNSSASD